MYCRGWGSLGKKTLVATERDEAARRAFQAKVAALETERLIVLDETGIHTALTRRYARAHCGQRAVGAVPRNHGKNISVLGALGLRGMVATMTIEGAVDTDVFDAFVMQVLVPVLQPGDVVVLDNLRVHHSSQIETAVEQVGGQVLFLPAYSPDFSPIEPCWAKLKTFLRSVGARTHRRLQQALRQALNTLTAADIRGWFRHCGYQVIDN